MVPSRHPLPTPAWAELPPTGTASDDTFRAFIHSERFDHRSRSTGARHFEALADVRSGLDDDEAPQLGLL